MCGICGIFDFKGNPIDRELLERMTDRIRHRGPDGDGYFVGKGVGLGNRRLSIIGSRKQMKTAVFKLYSTARSITSLN